MAEIPRCEACALRPSRSGGWRWRTCNLRQIAEGVLEKNLALCQSEGLKSGIRCAPEIAGNVDVLYSLLGYLCYALSKTIDTLMNSDGNMHGIGVAQHTKPLV